MKAPREPESSPPQRLKFHLTESVQWFLGFNLATGLAVLIIVWLLCGRSRVVDFDNVEPTVRALQVDLNAASWQELALLPGIGETLGQRILARRATQGPYTGVEQLIEVKGIGPRVLERIRPYLLVRQSSAASTDQTDSTQGEEY